MNANEFMKHLESLGACNEAKDWALGKSWREVYDTCHCGDWLIWLFVRSKDYDFQKVTLAKGLCANTIRHLMEDERSIKAVDAAIAFGKGEISRNQLDFAAAHAYAVFTEYACAAYAAPYAAAYAAASYNIADAHFAAAMPAYVISTNNDRRTENKKKTADIVREILPFEIWEF